MHYYITDECVACRRCAELCPVDAPAFNGDHFAIDPEKCVGCGTCAKNCPMNAIYPSDYAAPPAPEQVPGVREESCDVVVIGSGPAGLAAAGSLQEKGFSVTILEAAKLAGGAGVHATGYNVFDSKLELDAGGTRYMDDYVRAAMNSTKYQLRYSFLRSAFEANTEFFDWFCTFGSPEELFRVVDSPKGKSVMMDFTKPAGRFMVEKLLAHAQEKGAILRTCTKAKKLLMENGKTVGVLAEDRQGDIDFRSRAVLVATGNMCQAPDLEDYLPEFAHAEIFRNAHRLPTATGDGVRMIRQAGIPVDMENVASHYLGAMPAWFDGHVLKQGLRPEGLRVNNRGERYVSEGADRFDAVDVLLKQPGCVSFNIVDSNILNMDIQPTIKLPTGNVMMMEASLPLPGKPLQYVNFMGMPVQVDKDGNPMKSPMDGLEENRGMGNYPPDSKPDPERLREYARTLGGHVCAADTIEELAEQMGADPEALKATVARYNELCRKGRDEDFGKYTRYMIPIEQGPFYAFKCFLGTDGVFGGVFVDDGCRVVNGEDAVPGLYAAGDLTSGNYIKENSHRTEAINDFTWANASGFLAGKSMAADMESGNL